MNRIFQFTSSSTGASAAVVWIQETVASGAPALQFTPAMTAKLQSIDASEPSKNVGARQHWKLYAPSFQDKYWECLFQAAIAKPALVGSRGEQAARAVHERSLGHAVRLLQINTGEYLASYVTEGSSWYLFDPKSGLFEIGDAEVDTFVAHMKNVYKLQGQETEVYSWVVPFPIDLHSTWIGPPRDDEQELMCVRALRSAKLSADIAPALRFWCVNDFQDHYLPLLGNDVKLSFVDAELPTFGANLLTQPDFNDLGGCVATILWDFTRFLRPGSQSSDKSYLAFAKDIWSLYCLYKFGGYHLDAGMAVLKPANLVNLPFPTTFGANVFMENATNPTAYPHYSAADYSGSARVGLVCMSLCSQPGIRGILSPQGSLKRKLLKEITGSSPPRIRGIDAPILRSPKQSGGILKALQTYIYLWFALKDWCARNNQPFEHSLCREVTLSSIATGITHWRPPCPVGRVPEGSTFRIEADLNLKKYNFQTHVVPPPTSAATSATSVTAAAGR